VQIPIFWRLIFGYALILLLSAGVSAYSIVQLGRLSGTARAALNTDNRMISVQEKLTDAFLSEVRYAGKFVITHTASLHEQFRQFKNDFVVYMNEIKSLAASPETKARLSRVEELHLRYQDLFDREVRYIKAGQPYAESRFRQEREKVLESALGELDRLKRQLHTNLNDKLETIDTAARAARTRAAIATLFLLGLGIALSIAVSKSITRPLARLKRITVEQAEQDSTSTSEFNCIPEIRELSDALRTARRNLREEAETNNAFVHAIAKQFVTPLISLKKRLTYLERELTEKTTAEQLTTFQVLAEETERLIQRCPTLQTSPRAEGESRNGQEQMTSARVEESMPWRHRVWKRCSDEFFPRIQTAAVRAGSLMTGRWNAISHSIRTVGSGKAKKQ
jgi:CHASE3 domain sensor protein